MSKNRKKILTYLVLALVAMGLVYLLAIDDGSAKSAIKHFIKSVVRAI